MKIRTGLLGLLLAVGAVVVAVPGHDAAATGREISHKAATAKLRNANITWTSSGGCSNRNNPTCTSFTDIKSGTIAGIIAFKKASNCKITITGGTETGHQGGTYSHWNGYKVDIAPRTCVNNYIKRHYRYLGGNQWRSPAGNIYYNEGDHWDITYY
jgi:hypothetical protein